MYLRNKSNIIFDLMMTRAYPNAEALIIGDEAHPALRGKVTFFEVQNGTVVATEVSGLPTKNQKCSGEFFAIHIHDGAQCTGNASDPFKNAGSHYNPGNCEHPFHAGDLPDLMGNNGYALSVVFTDRFKPEDVIGRTVIIHANPDDKVTQPSGASGARIGCGEIKMM